jgi:hypothetical protein
MGCRTVGLGTAKVGDASLFEKPRSGARKIPRFSNIIDNDDHCAYNASCDSSACNAIKSQCQLDSDDDSAYYTDDACYKPKTTWQRQPCASYVIAAPSHLGSAQPVRKLTDDWKEIQGLSYDLLFEVLRLVLLVSLTIVRISTALIKSIGTQFDKWMLRALDLGYKGNRQSFTDDPRHFTGPADKPTGRTGCTKLTDVRKRHMSSSMSSTSDS